MSKAIAQSYLIGQCRWATIPSLDNQRCIIYDNGKETLLGLIVPQWFTEILLKGQNINPNNPAQFYAKRSDLELGEPAGEVRFDSQCEPGYISRFLYDRIQSPDYYRISVAIILNGELLWNDANMKLNTAKWPGEEAARHE